ncbi:MAG: 3-dehydroquinate synthase [Candidatus Acetothermia bacterium]
METVDVDLGPENYRIVIDSSSLEEVGEMVKDEFGRVDGAVITDENVERLYGNELKESLRKSGLDFTRLVARPGEGSKSLETAKRLYEDLAELSLHRDSVILAFGGGVIGDLAGFVGSTFLRGLPVIQVPTTLLAQVDSSVGGKTAVNLPQGKNLVGTFHQPKLVVIDPEVLSTLAPADVRSGLGEVLKYGLIWDADFFQKTVEKRRIFEGIEGNGKAAESIISRCCEIKAEVVEEDELDRGVRRILNFGHTLGHGIEAGSGYGEIKHGEAVIWGMIGESWISKIRGYISEEEFTDLVEDLTGFDLPPLPGELSETDLVSYVKRDKKAEGDAIYSVLLKDRIGNVVVEEVEEKEILDAWNYLKSLEV